MTSILFLSTLFIEKLYKEPAVRVPTLSRLSAIAKSLGLEMEDSELMAYRGGNLSNELLYKINYT